MLTKQLTKLIDSIINNYFIKMKLTKILLFSNNLKIKLTKNKISYLILNHDFHD